MPQLGLRQVIIVGATIDLLVGLWLWRQAGPVTNPGSARTTLIGAAALSIVITAGVPFDPLKLASGVYRYGSATRTDSTILFHRDGKTASVDVYRHSDGDITIATNGKPDAAIRTSRHAELDDYTMMLAGLLPALVEPQARHAAVIGIGSGRTTHSLLANPRLESVDTIEIEPAMIEGARLFGALTHRAFDDPRSHLHVEDAKTYFARNRQQYDLIVAEPSHPWVSGVSSLFSTEFYRQINRHLTPEGLFVQWVQIYEIDVPLVATIVKAIHANFDDYAIYATSDIDILIVARPKGLLPQASTAAFNIPELAAELNYIDLHSLADLNDRRIGSKATLAPYFFAQPLHVNSDYYPVLDQGAVKSRFLNDDASALLELRRASARLEGTIAEGGIPLTPKHDYIEGIYAQEAPMVASYLASRTAPPASDSRLAHPTIAVAAGLLVLDQQCDPQVLSQSWLPKWIDFSANYLPYLPQTTLRDLVARVKTFRCYAGAPAEIQDWIRLFDAIGNNDEASVIRLGIKIITTYPSGAAGSPLLAREMLLASIKTGDFVTARALAQRLDPSVYKESPVAYLRAYATAH
jgi:spermidine synthase